LSLHVFESLGT